MIIYICMCVHINLWQMHMHISTCKKQKSSSGVISQKAYSLFWNSHSLARDILCKLVGWPVSSCFLKLLLKIESNESRAYIFKTENLCESCFFLVLFSSKWLFLCIFSSITIKAWSRFASSWFFIYLKGNLHRKCYSITFGHWKVPLGLWNESRNVFGVNLKKYLLFLYFILLFILIQGLT